MAQENKITAALVDWAWVNHCARNSGHKILKQFQANPERPWNTYSVMEWQSLGIDARTAQALTQVDAHFRAQFAHWIQASSNHHFIPYNSDDYPSILREIPHPPIGLYAQGQIEILKKPQIAVVGSRRPSLGAERIADEFAYALSQAGYGITSGLALGIDASAHQGALRASGETIAVMATGMDRIYPSQHQELARKISASGLLVTEFSLGTQPLPAYFPQRNRIISGLCRGTLVVEAALKSGTLTTARHALEQNRDIFAIPGGVHNPNAQGCHTLIRQGAQLVTSPQDILIEWGSAKAAVLFGTGQNRIYCSHLDKEAQAILALMGDSPLCVDDIVERLQYPAQQVAHHLMELTLQGWIEAVPGGYIRIWRIPNERNCA